MNIPVFTPVAARALLAALSIGLVSLGLSGCSEKPGPTSATPPAAQKKSASDKPTGEKPATPPANSPAGRGGRRGMMGGPQTVSVVHPVIRTVPITMTAAATLSSPNAVTLTPQVSGTLQSVHVVSGQQVKPNQLLFSLDAAPFRTALNSAEAKLKGDGAQARYTQQQVKQLTPLVEKDYVTRQSFDQAVASAQAARALVSQDQAAVQTAKINLSYTEIRAPISGRLGEISLQPGNLVQANSTALTTLVSIQKLLVNFSLPQSVLTDLRREWPGMGQPDAIGKSAGTAPQIDILDEQAVHILAHGRLIFVDNTINATTGTIRLQGLINNDSGQLWPGQFVTARLTLREIPDAEVLPATALQLGDQGSFIYVVRNGKAETLAVHPIRTLATEVALPAGSVPVDTSVIYPLPGRIAPGMAVQIKTPPPPSTHKSSEDTAHPTLQPNTEGATAHHSAQGARPTQGKEQPHKAESQSPSAGDGATP